MTSSRQRLLHVAMRINGHRFGRRDRASCVAWWPLSHAARPPRTEEGDSENFLMHLIRSDVRTAEHTHLKAIAVPRAHSGISLSHGGVMASSESANADPAGNREIFPLAVITRFTHWPMAAMSASPHTSGALILRGPHASDTTPIAAWPSASSRLCPGEQIVGTVVAIPAPSRIPSPA